jgi:hypothetical protein
MERVMGIEPTWPAWKAGTLPLSYTRADEPGNHNNRARLVNATLAFAASPMEISKGQKMPRSFLQMRFSKFPLPLKFANKSAVFQSGNALVSIEVSRSFQFPHHTRKNGNFAW